MTLLLRLFLLVMPWYSSIGSYANKLKCRSDYMANLNFDVDLSSDFSYENEYKFYTGNTYDEACPWTEETDCAVVNKTLRCTMHTLRVQTHCATFQFILLIIDSATGASKKNITKFEIGVRGFPASPWTTSMKLQFCDDTVGIKYFAVYPTDYTKFKIDLFRYPLDFLSFTSLITLSINGSNNFKKNIALDQKYLDECVGRTKDSCIIVQENLEPCSRYRVCVSPSYIRCREVETKCRSEFRWQDMLLIIFGVIICGLSILFLSTKLKKKRTRSKIHSFSRFELVNDKQRGGTSGGGGADEASPENLYDGHFLD